MRLHPRLGLALALLIAALGIGSSITISRLWCDDAAFADANLLPTSGNTAYVPPPGPIYLENDSYYWLSYAQRIARGEDWRIRHTMMDGFPTGREVHWSQVNSWAMVAFGGVRALFTHEKLAAAIEKASVAINPVLFSLALVALFLAIAPRFGTLPTALLIAFLGTSGDTGWIFQALRPGHQGFHVVFGSISVLGLILGSMGLAARQTVPHERWPLFQTLYAVDDRTARRWFTIAGVATGLGLWVSATIESFFIYPMMGMFVVLLALVPRGRLLAEDLVVHPDLWRRWGWTAGAVGFAFYLIEYFPHHMAMRIEVNHPAYDLAAVGSGEALRLLSQWRWGGRQASRGWLVRTALWLALGALPVLMISQGSVAWHHMRDPQMLRLHNFIQEFYTYKNFVKTDPWTHFFYAFLVLPFLSPLAPCFLLRRDLRVVQVIWLWCSFALTCSFFVVAFLQVRWMGFFASWMCLSAMVSAHYAFGLLPAGNPARHALAISVLVLAFLMQPAWSFWRQYSDLSDALHGRTLQNEMMTPILNKRMAFALKASPERPRAVIGDPGLAPSLGYFAGIPVLASFYWENLDGLHDTVRFFGTKDPAEAHAIALRTGATHVILPPGAWLPNYFYFVAYGHYDTKDAATIFVGRLIEGHAPSWIQPDTVLSFITTNTYSYRGTSITNHSEIFRLQD